MGRYLEAMTAELDHGRSRLAGREIQTIFLGGGTPSLLSGEQVRVLLEGVRSRFCVARGAEISLESNPGTLTEDKVRGYMAAGVNRLSMGVQSFNPEELRWLGRTHTADDVAAGVEVFKKLGLKNFNLDLIFGLPNQTLAKWQENVNRALDLEPAHISLYHLTIEEGSTFNDVKRLPDPCDKEGAKLFEWTQTHLEQNGFEQYEISNYSRPGFRCRHNEVYWRNEDCLGSGAGAWTYLNGVRYLRPKTIEAYIEDVESGKFTRLEEEKLETEEAYRETLVFGLRTKEGVNLSRLQARFGQGPDTQTHAALERLAGQGLLSLDENRVQLTRKGFLFADTVAVELI